MTNAYRLLFGLPAAGLAAGWALPAAAAPGIDITVTIPRLSVAEYHRPYVAIWIEQAGNANVRNLAVWYDHDNREGTTWLRDMRTWWRKTGRTLRMPVAGITGATRAPGAQRQSFNINGLAPGRYELVVEAAREVGGREVVRLPFQWPATGAQTVRATGRTELGAISAVIRR
ncbi:MAG TPA: DUF2271 domain-containing protein [Allosphingosinicella sp.]|nr:DUF2271 domain-containing protein [Allosphingosinicella sp.]